jgi:hypothetical protein
MMFLSWDQVQAHSVYLVIYVVRITVAGMQQGRKAFAGNSPKRLLRIPREHVVDTVTYV